MFINVRSGTTIRCARPITPRMSQRRSRARAACRLSAGRRVRRGLAVPGRRRRWWSSARPGLWSFEPRLLVAGLGAPKLVAITVSGRHLILVICGAVRAGAPRPGPDGARRGLSLRSRRVGLRIRLHRQPSLPAAGGAAATAGRRGRLLAGPHRGPLVLKAVSAHTRQRWILLYLRWTGTSCLT